ncbi:peptidoglycan/LPS O-acetylase OafA/YrhL [Paenarthrobacter nicotinovorans]|uniref:acyltransferase family protein n=1 Tax=Paenarthrobacter nicotinovorans TaxID=29320 RepID=UPI002781FD9F|nr:acyltransferase family protein [Paenarthrobacter nicotinovorans]MDP9936308.1 peptidoglycan/LPS O-acetylase OafA/YrhL [Paenarthrobacter nicotinovorans]
MAQPTLTKNRPSLAGTAARKKSVRPDIQGLRAIAVLAVIFDHLVGWPSGGFVGVDIFFVISGFLITGLLLKEHTKAGYISFADFYRRRARRILPLAALVIVLTLMASWVIFPKGRAQGIVGDGFWALLFGANWRFAATGTDYMQAEGPVSPLQHFWSLAVEEQFYVIWPLLIVFVIGFLATRLGWSSGRSRHLLGTMMVLLVIADFTYATWESAASPTVAYFSTTSRAWELGIGALLAIWAGAFNRIPALLRPALGYVGLAGIGWSLFNINSSMAFPGPWAFVPVLSAALVILAGTGGEQRFLFPLTNRVSGYLGDISYSLYLWHFPMIILVGALMPVDAPITMAAVLIGIVAFSAASYHFLEDPIRKSDWLEPRGNRMPRKYQPTSTWKAAAGLGVLALLTVAVCGLAFLKTAPVERSTPLAVTPVGTAGASAAATPAPTGLASAGAAPVAQGPIVELQRQISAAAAASAWPELSPSIDALNGAFTPEWKDDKCLNTSDENIASCLYTEPGATKTAVLLGDSVSISWMQSLRGSLGKQGWSIQSLTMGQCPAVDIPSTRPNEPEGFTERCSEHQAWVMQKIAEMKPDMVILSSSLAAPWRAVSAETSKNVLGDWQTATVKRLQDLKAVTSADVVLLSGSGEGPNLQKCATNFSKPSDCVGNSDRYFSVLDVEAKAAAAVPGTRYVSTSSWFCTANRVCPAFVGTTPVFVDGTHITPAYAAKLAPVMGPALLGK